MGGWQQYNFAYTENPETCRLVRIRNTGQGTVRLYQILNIETGEGVYFDLTLQPDEEIVIVTGEEPEG